MGASPLRLLVIVGSTRPGRVGMPVATWFAECVEAQGGFDTVTVDLAKLDLPFLDEPNHPRLQQYVNQHTIAWSRRVEWADAVVVITPEYNYGTSAVLKNAFDFLHEEWAYKPLGVVSYGGVSAGTRAGLELRLVAAALRMFVVPEGVTIPFVKQFLIDGEIDANQVMVDAATTMLREVTKVARALAPLRAVPAA
jgi:NAD(P)H-dependent FMN reductase